MRANANAIFLAFDESYSIYARACLNSLQANYPDHPKTFVYYADSDAETQTFLQQLPNLELLNSRDMIDAGVDINLGTVGKAGVYYKYSAWSRRFSDYENV